jgi:hypothetical protein
MFVASVLQRTTEAGHFLGERDVASPWPREEGIVSVASGDATSVCCIEEACCITVGDCHGGLGMASQDAESRLQQCCSRLPAREGDCNSR